MPMVKIAVTVKEEIAKEIDHLVASGHYPNRSKVVQAALAEILAGTKKLRMAAECAKLDAKEEEALADEAVGTESWPEY